MELNYFLNTDADWIITQKWNQKSTDVRDIFKLIPITAETGTWRVDSFFCTNHLISACDH